MMSEKTSPKVRMVCATCKAREQFSVSEENYNVMYFCMIRMCQVMETKLDDKFFGFPFDRNIDFNIYDERYKQRKLLTVDV